MIGFSRSGDLMFLYIALNGFSEEGTMDTGIMLREKSGMRDTTAVT